MVRSPVPAADLTSVGQCLNFFMFHCIYCNYCNRTFAPLVSPTTWKQKDVMKFGWLAPALLYFYFLLCVLSHQVL